MEERLKQSLSRSFQGNYHRVTSTVKKNLIDGSDVIIDLHSAAVGRSKYAPNTWRLITS